MAYTAPNDSLIAVGKATVRQIFKTYLFDNIVNLNSRLTLVEGASNKIEIFKTTVYNATQAASMTGLYFFQADSAFSVTSATVGIFTKGSLTGNLEIDIQKSSSLDFTSSVSLFTTKPKVDYSTASSYDESANAVFDANNQDLVAGDWLRIDVSSLPTGGVLSKFTINVYGEAS